jgi:hypothetical protein
MPWGIDICVSALPGASDFWSASSVATPDEKMMLSKVRFSVRLVNVRIFHARQ